MPWPRSVSLRCPWAISISGRSVWRALTTRCATARSTRRGRKSITIFGTRSSCPSVAALLPACRALAIYHDRYLRVRQNLLRDAAHHQPREAATTVRGHEDHVASLPFCSVDDSLVG